MNNLKVIKFGSEVLANEYGLDQNAVNQYCRVMATEAESGLVIVTSGAVATGRSIYARGKSIGIEQVRELNDAANLAKFSMLGGAAVNMAWQYGFELQNILAGSLSVTHNEIDSSEGDVLTANVKANVKDGIVTIINEADALSDSELMKLFACADNDELARHLAVKLQAKTLALITKKGGILDESGDNITKHLNRFNIAHARQLVLKRQEEKPRKNEVVAGRGGMLSKIDAAVTANEGGVANVMIASPEGLIVNGLSELAHHSHTTTVSVIG